jgi:NUMOD3 motif
MWLTRSRDVKSGEQSPIYGKRRSEEDRRKMRDGWARRRAKENTQWQTNSQHRTSVQLPLF